MIPDLTPIYGPLIGFCLLVAIVLALALYRYMAVRKEDLHIHFEGNEVSTVGEQATLASRVIWADHWGKALTVVAIVYFLALLSYLLYLEWQKGAGILVGN
jgi:hypothetical protein